MRFDLDKGKLVDGDSDRAAACVPGRLKTLDASIDRWKREKAQEERAARKDEAMRTRCLRVEARLLLARGLAQTAVRHQIAQNRNPPTVSEMQRILKTDAWYNPEMVLRIAIQVGATI